MLLEKTKEKTEKIFGSFGKLLFKIGINPNIATLISSVFTFLAIYYFFKGELRLGGVMLVLDYFFDMMDGIIARVAKKENDLGYFLDRVSDDFRKLCWVGFAFGGLLKFPLAMLALFFDSIGTLLPRILERSKLKKPKWFFTWIGWFMIPGALLNQIEFFTLLIVLISPLLLIFNVIVISFLNRVKKKK